LASAFDGLRDRLRVAADDLHVDAFQWQAIAWLWHNVLPGCADRRVGLEHRRRALVIRNDGVMVDEGANREQPRQFGHTARVIAVEMCESEASTGESDCSDGSNDVTYRA
jgi:hypothetical protein